MRVLQHVGAASAHTRVANSGSATGGSGDVSCSFTAFDRTLTTSGTYTGSDDATYTVEVYDDTVSPNLYRWRKNSGSWTTEYMNSTAGPTETLGGEGVKLAWANTHGHTTVRRCDVCAPTIVLYQRGPDVPHGLSATAVRVQVLG